MKSSGLSIINTFERFVRSINPVCQTVEQRFLSVTTKVFQGNYSNQSGINYLLGIFTFIIFLGMSSFSSAQSFTASAPAKVGSDERFQISFTIEASEINSVTSFQPPAMNDFLILSGPNQSQSMQIINGAVSGSRSFSYIIQAKNIGKFTIPPASVNYKGAVLRSNSLTIEVVKGVNKQKNKEQEAGISNSEIAENLFIRAIVDKNSVYKGEQVNVTYKLYTRLNMSSPQISKLPSYQGFWAEEIESPQNINFVRENYDGKVFNVAVIKKAALFPTETGDLSVTPFELKIPVVYQKRSRSNNPFDAFFDDPFFGRTETVEFNAKSNTVRLKVLPLPDTDIKSFNGAVGNYSLSASINTDKPGNTKKVKQNEPVTIKLDITGSGNIKLIPTPEILLPAGFEQYEPKITEEVSKSGLVSGRKRIEYLLVPRSEGDFEIPPIEFTFFDLKKKSYVTLKTESFNIEVAKGDADYAAASNLSKDDIRLLKQDIRFIKTELKSISRKGAFLIYSPFFLALVFLPLFGFTGLLLWKHKERKLLSNLSLMKNQKAEKTARLRLKNAAKYMKENRSEEFYSEISLALLNYLEDKLLIPKSELTLETAISKLKESNTDESLITEIKGIMEICEFIRFSPDKDSKTNIQNLYDSTRRIIVSLEDNQLLKLR